MNQQQQQQASSLHCFEFIVRFLLAHPRLRVFHAGLELCVFFPQNLQGLFQVGRQGLFAKAALLGVLAVLFAVFPSVYSCIIYK